MTQQHNGKISHRLESQIIYIFRNYQASDLEKKKKSETSNLENIPDGVWKQYTT